MDGVQKRLKDSLQLRLSLWLSLSIVGVALVAGVSSFTLVFNEAHELQDGTLRQTAALLNTQHLPAPQADGYAWRRDVDPEAQLLITPVPGRIDPGPHAGSVHLSRSLADGMQTSTLGGVGYRIFVKRLGPNRRIAVAQQTAVRNEAAFYSGLLALVPFLILIPVLLIVVARLTRLIFAPVSALAGEVDRRSEQDLAPVPAEPLPKEVRPFVIAINRLLQRVAESVAMQRRFIAAAAHELRTPLTALSLQAERLAAADMSDEAGERLATLRRGIERNRALVDQLLAFTRVQSTIPVPAKAISARHVLREVLEQLMPLADTKDLDIGVNSRAEGAIQSSEIDFTTIVTNLLTNAIRYTPSGGRIDLTVTETNHTVTIVVEDNGPGISPAERARVFEPFYRQPGGDGTGSGLGLAIVKAVLDRLGGHIALSDAANYPSGLRVTLTLPATYPIQQLNTATA